MSAPARSQVLSLYRTLLRESSKFENYNFRVYFTNKVRNTFRQHSEVEDAETSMKLYNEAVDSVDVIRRQAIIGKLYEDTKVHLDR